MWACRTPRPRRERAMEPLVHTQVHCIVQTPLLQQMVLQTNLAVIIHNAGSGLFPFAVQVVLNSAKSSKCVDILFILNEKSVSMEVDVK